jgi:hypothetical protein
MEAVSRGAAEAGGHVIGVTCDEIEAWRPVAPNAWVQEERRFASMQERLNELVRACQAAIAMPGGPGTLTEIALTWNLMIVQAMPPKPLILTGPGWKSVMESLYKSFDTYIPPNLRVLIQYADGIQEAVDKISKMA